MAFKWFFLAPSIATIGFLISLISIGSDKWYSGEYQEVPFYEGLWRLCYPVPDQGQWTCRNIHIGEHHAVDAVRTLVLLSVVAYFVAAIVALVAFIKDNEFLSIGAAVATLFEALIFAVGLIVYVAKIVHDNHSSKGLRWSYGTGWAAVFILLLGTGAYVFQTFLLKSSKRESYVPLN